MEAASREEGNGLDFLDAALNVEDSWFQEGFDEGRAAGRERGYEEGLAVGHAKGFEVGCELGYYTSCCRAWLEIARGPSPAGTEKAIKTLEGILKMVEDFPRQNSPDVDMADRLQRLRARFKAAASLIGVTVSFNLHKKGDMSF